MSDLERAMNGGPLAAPAPKAPRKRASTAKKAKKAKAKKVKAPKAAKAKKARRGRADISLDLGAAMNLMGSMHRTDLECFQAITGALGDKGMKARKRILSALSQVYAK